MSGGQRDGRSQIATRDVDAPLRPSARAIVFTGSEVEAAELAYRLRDENLSAISTADRRSTVLCEVEEHPKAVLPCSGIGNPLEGQQQHWNATLSRVSSILPQKRWIAVKIGRVNNDYENLMGKISLLSFNALRWSWEASAANFFASFRPVVCCCCCCCCRCYCRGIGKMPLSISMYVRETLCSIHLFTCFYIVGLQAIGRLLYLCR